MTGFVTIRKVVTTVTTNVTLTKGNHTPVSASGGARTVSLPTGANEGAYLSAEKTDSSANTVTISGNIRGSAGSTIVLRTQREMVELTADSAGSWWPTAGDRSWASLDAAYTPIAHATDNTNPHSVTASQVGLGNANNTSDLNKPVSTAGQTALDLKANLSATLNAQTGTTYTFVLADNGKVVTGSNGGAITFTVPPNSSVAFPVGTGIDVIQLGAAQITLAAGSGVTLSSRGSLLKTAGQFGVIGLLKVATDTWIVTGDLA